jgi:hypothetical protein
LLSFSEFSVPINSIFWSLLLDYTFFYASTSINPKLKKVFCFEFVTKDKKTAEQPEL